MERLIDSLRANRPDDEQTSLVPGDFRIDNLILRPSEPRVLAVLGWELSTPGHPLVDAAHHAKNWRVTPEEFCGLKGHDLAACARCTGRSGRTGSSAPPPERRGPGRRRQRLP